MPDDPVVTDPPAEPPAGGEPTPPVEPEPPTIARDVLPEELRDQDPEQVKMYLSAMRQGLTTRQIENDQLRQDLEEARAGAVPAHAVPDIEPPDKKSKEELQQLILDDPEAVLDYYAERKFGPMLRNLGTTAGEGVYAAAYQRWPDFAEVEPVVRGLIKDSGQAPTAALIEGAYTVAQGRIHIQDKKDALAKASVSSPPSPPAIDDGKPTLTKLQEEIAAASGLSKEEMIQFKDADEMTMEVPLG